MMRPWYKGVILLMTKPWARLNGLSHLLSLIPYEPVSRSGVSLLGHAERDRFANAKSLCYGAPGRRGSAGNVLPVGR